jgi:YceI-like protein
VRKLLIVSLILVPALVKGQIYESAKGQIKFYSEEVLENITAINKKVKSIFNTETGQIVFSLPINAFVFKKALMQEHFNEKYLESEKFPKSSFYGKITGYIDGLNNQEVWAEGELEIHGIKHVIRVPGKISSTTGRIVLHSTFYVKLVDYEIKVPEIMFQKIAEEIEVTVDIEYKPYEKE